MFIAWRDWVSRDASVITLSAGVQNNSSDNAKDRRLAKPWSLTLATAATYNINIDFGGALSVGMIAMLGHTFPQNTQLVGLLILDDVEVGNVSFGNVWLPPSGSGIQRSAFILFNENTVCDRMVLRVITNTADITADIGRIWAGPKWEPHLGAMFQGMSAGVVDPSRVVESQGGQVYAVDRARRRTLRMALTLPESDAIGTAADPDTNAQSLLFEAGNSGSVIVVPTTEGATAAEREHIIHRLGVYGILQRSSDLELLDRANVSGAGSERLYRLSLDVLEQL